VEIRIEEAYWHFYLCAAECANVHCGKLEKQLAHAASWLRTRNLASALTAARRHHQTLSIGANPTEPQL
jgi:hypothetical protein